MFLFRKKCEVLKRVIFDDENDVEYNDNDDDDGDDDDANDDDDDLLVVGIVKPSFLNPFSSLTVQC